MQFNLKSFIDAQLLAALLLFAGIVISVDAVWSPRSFTPKLRGISAMERLYDDVMYSYKKSVRPVKYAHQKLVVAFSAYLIQLVDVDEKHQVLTTKLWLELEWTDSHLQWNPLVYDNISRLHLRSEDIWIPDILLYNNADGHPQINVLNDVMVSHTGKVQWKPPAIYKSFCEVDVTWFPYDEQTCYMKFGTWSYDGLHVDMVFKNDANVQFLSSKRSNRGMQHLTNAMDLSYYNPNMEWEILNLTAVRHEEIYPGCCGTSLYIDITFYFHIRRMTLFYSVNLLLPCVMISLLTIVVFHLPSGTREKITICLSILITLSVFLLLLVDMMPPTSISIPLIGKYLLLDMTLVTACIVITVITQNLYFRDENSEIQPWVRKLFLQKIAKLLRVERPIRFADEGHGLKRMGTEEIIESGMSHPPTGKLERSDSENFQRYAEEAMEQLLKAGITRKGARIRLLDLKEEKLPPLDQHYLALLSEPIVQRAMGNIDFIANHHKELARRRQIAEEWSFLALVLNRFFLWIFLFVTVFGTGMLLLHIPAIYDTRKALDVPHAAKPLGYADVI